MNVIKPPLARGGGFAEGKDGGVVANAFSKLYVSHVAMKFVEIITYYPSVSYADISPRKGRPYIVYCLCSFVHQIAFWFVCRFLEGRPLHYG